MPVWFSWSLVLFPSRSCRALGSLPRVWLHISELFCSTAQVWTTSFNVEQAPSPKPIVSGRYTQGRQRCGRWYWVFLFFTAVFYAINCDFLVSHVVATIAISWFLKPVRFLHTLAGIPVVLQRQASWASAVRTTGTVVDVPVVSQGRPSLFSAFLFLETIIPHILQRHRATSSGAQSFHVPFRCLHRKRPSHLSLSCKSVRSCTS